MPEDEDTRRFESWDERDNIDTLRAGDHYLKARRAYMDERGVTEDEYAEEVIRHIEEVTGPLNNWQRVYAYAAVSGRGVEWAQTRGRPHYHIVGLPCTVCGRK